MDLVRASLVLVALVMVGCGGGGPAPVAVQPPAQATGSDAVKLILDGVAASGVSARIDEAHIPVACLV